MSTPSPTSPPKRPRLSLQIRAIANGPTGRTSRTLAAAVDVKSPTSFNTLSNVYATAVDRSTPVQEKPPQNVLGSRPSLRLQTQDPSSIPKERRLQTPYLGPYLDTPLTAQPISPAIPKQVYFPSAMTATPPMSAIGPEQEGSRVFTFDSQQTPNSASSGGRVPQSATGQPRRAKTMPANSIKPPYTHPRNLRSILRNSPLPPLSTKSPESPRRQSLRLQEKAARRVAYNSPLCQTISTSKYTVSHIDLLADDATPTTPSASDGEDILDQTMAYTGNETRDGGQTPGPFEEMRRRMAGLRASTPTALSPTSAGVRKRGKKKEKKRRWVWTIGQDGEDAEELGSPVVEMDTTTAAPPVASKPSSSLLTPVTVPVIAVPLPKPRTRMQAAKTAAALQQVKISTPSVVPTAPVPLPVAAVATEQQQQPSQVQELHAPAPAFSSSEPSRLLTPEPPAQQQQPLIEPPTPSVESVASTFSHDSVFEGRDVEMSDASSMFSDCCDSQFAEPVALAAATPKLDTANLATSRRMDVDGDMDMDMDTPTATAGEKAVSFQQ